MTDIPALEALRIPTPENPLRVLMSACLAGALCGYDGTNNGEYPTAQQLKRYETVRIIPFCPEDYAFGTPREMCDIHGGTGLDVLEGRAKVLSESGLDWSEGMIRASEHMLELARQEQVELAVLMDISAACGSQVIYSGSRFQTHKVYQIGAGVCAAQLIRNGFTVISQRDYAALEIVFAKADPSHRRDLNLKDHHETDWYRTFFGR